MVYIFLLSLALISCEKEITVDMPTPENKIVVEAAIEEGQYAWAFISRTAAYFAPVDSAIIMNMIVKNAVVVVTDGIENDTLHLSLDPYTFPYLKYVGSKIIGQAGKQYWITITVDEKTYHAKTTIPHAVSLDSLKFKPDNNQDTLGFIWLYLKDPDTLGNYYRAFTKVLGKDSVFLHPYPSVSDDRFFNGQKAEYQLYRGRNPLEDNNYNPQGLDSAGVARWYFRTGETVIVKITQIDNLHYRFWYSMEQQFMTDGNPFATPTSLKTNIEGGAIGVWGGYGVFIDTLKIPKYAKN
ncbi:MAG TPA: DUF4249 domain-containing protein [Bacteroidales bacterium]|nr:DUF4249 domain-containing protein [Bacteroidales bacterium]HOU98015.1 DUF4249 domain-containing protein [Bacteroidales bacterium]